MTKRKNNSRKKKPSSKPNATTKAQNKAKPPVKQSVKTVKEQPKNKPVDKPKRMTRKYKPRNEFRRNNSPEAIGHYDYVFGETATHYKSLGLTTSPKANDKYTYYKLSKNPNPKDSRDSYLRLNVRSTNKKYLHKKPEKGWGFAKEDMPVVRHTIKKYKKSTNRKPKNWYILKREKNKKNNKPMS